MLSKSALLILGIISEEPINPYSISKLVNYKRKNIRESSIIPTSSIYGIINMLQNKKLIKGKKIKNGKLPDRKIFCITDKGQEILRDNIISNLRNPENDLLGLTVAITLMDQLDKEVILEALSEYKDEISREIAARKKLLHADVINGVPFIKLIGLKHILNTIKVNLKTVNELMKRIEEEKYEIVHTPVPFWRDDAIKDVIPRIN
jgi:DNA-binding PadR family transcriptional regulator